MRHQCKLLVPRVDDDMQLLLRYRVFLPPLASGSQSTARADSRLWIPMPRRASLLYMMQTAAKWRHVFCALFCWSESTCRLRWAGI